MNKGTRGKRKCTVQYDMLLILHEMQPYSINFNLFYYLRITAQLQALSGPQIIKLYNIFTNTNNEVILKNIKTKSKKTL